MQWVMLPSGGQVTSERWWCEGGDVCSTGMKHQLVHAVVDNRCAALHSMRRHGAPALLSKVRIGE